VTSPVNILRFARLRVSFVTLSLALSTLLSQPAERYALSFRESRDPHPWVAPEVLREIEASFAVEERAWELEQLRAVAEDEERSAEADAELLQLSSDGAAGGSAAGAELYAKTLRGLQRGIRVRAVTGDAWEERTDEARQERFYYNVDTKEAVWEKPLVLRARAATQRARSEGFAGLHHLPAVALRIMRFLAPAPDRLHRVSGVCRTWRALAEHPALFKFVRQGGHSGGVAASSAALDPFVARAGAALAEQPRASTECMWSPPRRVFDSIPAALATAVPGDTIVVASGSHYVPHPLEVSTPVRIVSQVRELLSAAFCAHFEQRVACCSHRTPRQRLPSIPPLHCRVFVGASMLVAALWTLPAMTRSGFWVVGTGIRR
jgi:hypothetical protein